MDGYKKELLHVGDLVTGIYYDDNDKVYMFNSMVIDRMVQNIPLYKLSVPKILRRIQRREHVRVPVTMPILYKELNFDKDPSSGHEESREHEAGQDSWKKGMALDLSGGGMNISLDKPLEENQHILIQLNTDGLELDVKGQIVRSYTEVVLGRVSHRAGVCFVDLAEADRDRIIGFVFKKQRDMRQKGVF